MGFRLIFCCELVSVHDSYKGDQSEFDSRPIGCCMTGITEVGPLLTTACYLACTCVCRSCNNMFDIELVQDVREVFGKL